MIALRIILLLGLVVHKLVWEVMKRRESNALAIGENAEQMGQKKPLGLNLKSAVKLGKSVFLVFLIIQTMFLDLFPISDNSTTIRVVGLIIYMVGLTTAITGRIQLGNNWVDLEDFTVLPAQKLVNSGIYKYIRHPIYIGDALLIIGLELALNSWLVVLGFALLPVIYKQALDEEAILTQAFPEYREYKQHTKMFVPFLV
jgi:protein-S-isoprenylcysteine O-methyltransferase Ste14